VLTHKHLNKTTTSLTNPFFDITTFPLPIRRFCRYSQLHTRDISPSLASAMPPQRSIFAYVNSSIRSSAAHSSSQYWKLYTNLITRLQTPHTPHDHGSLRRKCMLHRTEVASSYSTQRGSKEGRPRRQLLSRTRTKRYDTPFQYPNIFISRIWSLLVA
jgi:hypothetical protein